MKISAGVLVATLLTTSVALAQDAGIPHGGGPGGVPFGAGTQRGLQSLNNSGQNGFVTLFGRGPRTGVVVQVDGSRGRSQRAVIMRAKSCDALTGRVAYRLDDLQGGISRSYAPMSERQLLSGNYVTVVFSNNGPGARPAACGELYQ